MLKPPLSTLSDDLLSYIVELSAEAPSAYADLPALCLADRAFTDFCQKCIFRTFQLHGYSTPIPEQLKKRSGIFKERPMLAHLVREIQINSLKNEFGRLFSSPDFIFIFQMLSESPVPPYKLTCYQAVIEDQIDFSRRLSETLLSQTLTVLNLQFCQDIPVTLFMYLPQLKELSLETIEAAGITSYEKYPSELLSVDTPPKLEYFSHVDSPSIVTQMVFPPPQFPIGVAKWNNLRVLKLSPHENDALTSLQPILDEASKLLEELWLDQWAALDSVTPRIPLARFVNLGGLSNLQIFSLHIKVPDPETKTIEDVNKVLETIPSNNKIKNISARILTYEDPLPAFVDNDWAGFCKQLIRIGGNNHVEVDLVLEVVGIEEKTPEQEQLYLSLEEKLSPLTRHPNICSHIWNPSDRHRDVSDLFIGRVRARCST